MPRTSSSRVISAVFVIVLGLPLVAIAQQPPGTMQGTIADDIHTALPGVTLRAPECKRLQNAGSPHA